VRANKFEEVLREQQFEEVLREQDIVLGPRRFEGALMQNGIRAKWRNTHDFLVPGRSPSYGWIPQDEELSRGKWDNEEGVKTSLYARMEYFLTMIISEEYRLPDKIIADLTNRLRPLVIKSAKRAVYGGGRWGMGSENTYRREYIEAVALKAILKLHKPPPLKSRPVGRGHASQMKAWEKLVASFLVVVLEESEIEKGKNREEPTVLKDSRVFVQELEKVSERCEEEYNKNEKQGEEIMLAIWDISAMYPSLKIEYIVREVDTLLVERIGQRNRGAERDAAKESWKVIMPRLAFMLQHQLVYVRDEGVGEAGKKIFYWQKEGMGIGSSAS